MIRRGDMYGIVASERMVAGDVVVHIEGERTLVATRYSVQVGPDEHIEPPAGAPLDGPYAWRFMNHHCDPNSAIRGLDVVALRTIEEGEEITYDYATTEAEMAEPFLCQCGSPKCRGQIRGFLHLSTEEQATLRPRLADHLVAGIGRTFGTSLNRQRSVGRKLLLLTSRPVLDGPRDKR